ncbi:Ku protein [Xylanibacillus composti]|uniref:Non-homologous end joining protein Ku n=1 Tax=Xylanibacillus composti TaxID=1572762 RepID=A0A8J4H0M8_9BACL|nr:Ku protein [Xylanibacillus composti]MDT9723846.1 Ku protein [Xylanibacillus composti]GIQ67375.1 non-homologous end joining protein Ku [Xylanibacillus composti]
MHTIWKGAVSFGLVHVPVKMFSATEDKDISMRMIHQPCGTPVGYVRRCATCDTDVVWEDIVKGYEYEKGHFVLFSKEELNALNGEVNKEIKILDFVDIAEIDPVYFQKTYYLAPGDTGSNAYSLLLQALRESGKIGIAQVSIRSKSSLAAIRVVEGCLAMETIFYPDEIRPVAQVPNLPEKPNVDEKELTMAKMLIDQLTVPFEPEKYQDETRQRTMEAIQQKIAGEEVQTAPQQPTANVADLMAALQASLAAVQTDPGEAPARKRKSAAGKKEEAKQAAGAEEAKPAAKKRATKGKAKKES